MIHIMWEYKKPEYRQLRSKNHQAVH